MSINPFAKRPGIPVEVATANKPIEPMAESYLGAVGIGSAMLAGIIGDAVRMAGGALQEVRQTRCFEARCGGRFKRNSIKQRTRLNRDLRNKERRYAKYASIARLEFNYANQ